MTELRKNNALDEDEAKPTKEQLDNALSHYGSKRVPTNLPGLFPGSADAEVGKDHRTVRTLKDKKGRVMSTKTLGSLAVIEKVPKLKTVEASAAAAGPGERPNSARSGATAKTYNMTQYTGGQTHVSNTDMRSQQQATFDSTKVFE